MSGVIKRDFHCCCQDHCLKDDSFQTGCQLVTECSGYGILCMKVVLPVFLLTVFFKFQLNWNRKNCITHV